MAAISWKIGSSGNWSQASNWTSGTVPGFGDDVTINAAGTYTVTVDGSDGANTLVFNASGATLSLPSGRLLQVSGGTLSAGTIDGSGRLVNAGVTSVTSGQSLTLGGGLTWFNYYTGSSAPGTVNDAGAINVGDLVH
jgi:hypothetical protein